MPKSLVNILTYLVTLGLGIFLIWLSVKDLKPEDIEKIKFAIKKANYILLIPILIMGFISHWSRAVRWTYLMEPMGFKPSVTNTTFAVFIGYLANLAFPRLGEVLKCTLLARYEKVPADKLVGTIIAERAFDMLCLLIIFVLTIITQTDLAGDYLSSLWTRFNQSSDGESSSGKGYWVLIGIAVLVLSLLLFRKRILQSKFAVRFREVLLNVGKGILSFRTMKNKRGFVLHTLLIWSMYFGMILLGFQSIQETSHLGYKTGLSVLSFGSVGMIVTPGGLGAYTALVQEIVGLYGIDKAISVAISWIIWLVPTLIIILGGVLSFIFLPFVNKNRNVK